MLDCSLHIIYYFLKQKYKEMTYSWCILTASMEYAS